MSIRLGIYQNLIRHGTTVALCLFLLTGLSACLTSQADGHTDNFDNLAATKMFNVAFSYINDIYIEQPNIGALVMAGLNGLRRFEPGLAVVRAEDHKSKSCFFRGPRRRNGYIRKRRPRRLGINRKQNCKVG